MQATDSPTDRPINLTALALFFRPRPFASRASHCLATLLLACTLAACGQAKNNASAGAKGPGAGGPKSVGYVVVKESSVPMVHELAGRASAYRQSEVRPQVSGLIHRRLFNEGAKVKQGQPLYEIDPSVYRATLNEAQANLQSMQATAVAAKAKAERYEPLAKIEAVSQQDYADAKSEAQQAVAKVAQARAQVATARINLRFTTVPAPISGQIGRSAFTQGALVTANQAAALTQISQLDPIFVDMQQPAADLLSLRRSLAQKGVVPASAEVQLSLPDGSDYGRMGKVEFSETIVDPNTGTVTLRARFDNPDGILLPGMFVRAKFAQAIDQTVILVPQQAVTRDPKGTATVYVVDDEGKAQTRQINTTRTQGKDWVVTQGLKAGEKVIVQGTANLKPGAPVKAVPADAPQDVAPPASQASSASAAQS